MFERFQKMIEEQIRQHVEQSWSVTTHVNGNGRLIDVARLNGQPLEVINGQLGTYQLNLN